MAEDTLNKLQDVITARRGGNPDTSYVAKLFKKGINKIAEKVGEESFETVIASLNEEKENVVNESADLLFHLSVLWAARDVTPDDVMKELERRMGISGLDEKSARKSEKKDAKKKKEAR